MAKWIAIGDIHGRQNWKSIVNTEINQVDRIIFVGDYFDSFDIDMPTQINNFKDLLELKKSYPDKVVLLTGNHDIHYLSTLKEKYSGYNSGFAYIIENDCILPAIKDRSLQMCHVEDDIIFTHAGITNTWLLLSNIVESIDNIVDLDIELNDAFYYKPNTFRFQSSYKFSMSDNYGDNIWQGPLWVRPRSLIVDKIDGYKQVVGHTEMNSILDKNGIYFIDCLEENYYLYSDGVNAPEIKQLSL